MPVVYKSFDYQTEARDKAVEAVDSTTKQEMDSIVSSFVNLFKAKHL